MKPYAVVMAGGRGERFWPLSTPQIPKPFLRLISNESLLQSYIKRIRPLFGEENILLVLERSHLVHAQRQLPFIPDKNYIIEPVGRDTAACIGLASIYLERIDKDAIMVVLAADHYIPDEEEFLKTLAFGIDLLKENNSVITLGMKPTRPETGYGYIKPGKQVLSMNGFEVYRVDRFIEKPDKKTAKRYVSSGKYYWNSGIFLWRNSLIQELLAKFMPDHWRRLTRIAKSLDSPEEGVILEEEFSQIEKISIDYGVLEKIDDALVIPARFKWDDVGTWVALERLLLPDENGNIIRGRHIGLETENCIIHTEDGLVATMGVKNLVIIQANNKILVASKESTPDLKRLVRLCNTEQ